MSSALATALFYKGFFGAGLASLGFGVLFNVRGRNLLFAGLTGAVGGLIYEYGVWLRFNEGLSCFFAALAIGILGEIFARQGKTTVTTFTACALIPLVPGGMAYEMMVDFATGDISSGAIRFVDMLSVSGMLAFAILLVSTMTRFFSYSRHQVGRAARKIVHVEKRIRSSAASHASSGSKSEDNESRAAGKRSMLRRLCRFSDSQVLTSDPSAHLGSSNLSVHAQKTKDEHAQDREQKKVFDG